MTGWKHNCAKPECGKPVLATDSHVARAKLDSEGNAIPGEWEVFHFICAYPNWRANEVENVG